MTGLTSILAHLDRGRFGQLYHQQLVRIKTYENTESLYAEVWVTITYDSDKLIRSMIRSGSLEDRTSLLIIHSDPIINVSDQSPTILDDEHWVNKYSNSEEFKFDAPYRRLRREGEKFEVGGPWNNKRVEYPIQGVKIVDGSRLSQELPAELGIVKYVDLPLSEPHILRYSFETEAGIEKHDDTAIIKFLGPTAQELRETYESLTNSQRNKRNRQFNFFNYIVTPVDFEITILTPERAPLHDIEDMGYRNRIKAAISSLYIDGEPHFVRSYSPDTTDGNLNFVISTLLTNLVTPLTGRRKIELSLNS